MAIPVDNAGVEDVPLEALPSKISSALQETAASPGTGSGDSESVPEPQITEEDTATVSPEAPATSLNHGQHNLVRKLTIKRSELVIIIVATCIALAGLFLQFRANRLSKEANELARKGNAVAHNSYKLQLWDDCHDRQDLQNSSLCQKASSLIRRDAVFGKLQHVRGELNKKVLPSVHITFHGCSSLFPGNPVDRWHCGGSGLVNIIVCMFSCHVCSLFVLRDPIFRLIGVESREKLSAAGRASSSMSGLWFYAFAIPQIFLAVLINLSTGFDADRACALALALLFASYLAVERRIQRLRQDSTIAHDEEAQGHGREEPDLRTLPAIGRETSLAYVQKLKRRLATYVYQQDN